MCRGRQRPYTWCRQTRGSCVPSWLPHGGRRGMGRVIPRPNRRRWTGPPPTLCVSPRSSPPWFHRHTTVRSRAPGRPWGSMLWIQPFLQPSDFFHFLCRDFNVNRGWDLSCPLTRSAISASVLDVFEGTPIQVVSKATPGPTWVLPQGHFGSRDHLLITKIAQFSVVVTKHTESVFPSDHFPIC